MMTCTVRNLHVVDEYWWADPTKWVSGMRRKMRDSRWHYSSMGEAESSPEEAAVEHMLKLAKHYQERKQAKRAIVVQDIVRRDSLYQAQRPESYPFERMQWIADDLGISRYDVQDAIEEAEWFYVYY